MNISAISIKAYPFRLHFPKTYNPSANDGKKYPVLVFFHGLGESDTSIYDNELPALSWWRCISECG